jgi:hypothetical protein
MSTPSRRLSPRLREPLAALTAADCQVLPARHCRACEVTYGAGEVPDGSCILCGGGTAHATVVVHPDAADDPPTRGEP